MKKVLWITSFFLPRVNVAAVRNVKFLKYLPDLGWEPLVVCPNNSKPESEASRHLAAQLKPSVSIARHVFDPFLWIRDHDARCFRPLRLFMNCLFPPDGHVFWAAAVICSMGTILRRFRPDVVYTSCSPFSVNLIGAWIKNKYNIPWVTDFRDLWMLNPISRRRLPRYYIHSCRYLERRWAEQCNALILNTPLSAERMLTSYPLAKDKLAVIPNGFDQDDLPSLQQAESGNTTTLFYGGTVYPGATDGLYQFIELLARAVASSGIGRQFEVHYAGPDGGIFAHMARKSGLGTTCIDHGPLSLPRYYQLLKRMNWISFWMPPGLDTRSWIPARVYDYIASGSRILCFAQRGSEVVDLIRTYGKAIIVYHDEPEEVRLEKLRRFLSQEDFPSSNQDEYIRNYSRRSLAQKLSEVLDACRRSKDHQIL